MSGNALRRNLTYTRTRFGNRGGRHSIRYCLYFTEAGVFPYFYECLKRVNARQMA